MGRDTSLSIYVVMVTFNISKKKKKKVNMNQDVQGSLKCWSEVNNTNMNPYVKNTYTQI